MPTYLFRCAKCGIEVTVGLDPRPVCCGKPMNRVFTPPAIIFKGSGFTKSLTSGL